MAAAEGSALRLPWEADPEEFAGGCLQPILKEWLSGSAELPTVCYLQPGAPSRGEAEPPIGQISIKPAFTSPDNLRQCKDFLEGQAAQSRAQAAVIFARKADVAYPRVWEGAAKSRWPFGVSDGLFMQLESPTRRYVYFTAVNDDGKGNRSIGETKELDPDAFSLFPRLKLKA